MSERAQLGLLGLVLEDQPFQHGLRGLALVIVELLQRLELPEMVSETLSFRSIYRGGQRDVQRPRGRSR